MKKFIALLIVAVTLTCSACSAFATIPDDYYLLISEVIAPSIYDATMDLWLVESKDENGNIWQWYADDASWQVHDGAILLMESRGGASILDDEVIQVKYFLKNS